uniref:Interleukin n=1 Tax=Oncorhynchus kisutch TaxID=8019 RepID=A0A8C7MUQ8_ONCKI
MMEYNSTHCRINISTQLHYFLTVCFYVYMICVVACYFLSYQESFDCRLYTPTLADYQKCPTSTLICFEKEVNVLVLESGNKSSPIYKPKLSIRLKSLIKQKEGANCPDCEAHRERTAKDFLTTLQTILEWMNDQGCRKPSSH